MTSTVSTTTFPPAITKNFVAILSITAIWLIMAILINPVGNFPLNDDWAYAASVKEIINGHFVMPDWSAANIIYQLLWGAVFSKVLGFSYTVLRISTLVLGLLGVLYSYKILRQLGQSNTTSLIAALTLAVNPVYLASSYTFMTDVPFFALSTLALFHFLRAVQQDKWTDIALGTLFAISALLIRQVGFAIPLAFAISYLVGKKISKNVLLKGLTPLILCVLIQSGFKFWLDWSDQTPSMFGHQILLIKKTLSLPLLEVFTIYIKNSYAIFMNIALFTLPILLICMSNNPIKLSARKKIILVGLAVLLYSLLKFKFPLIGNVFNKNGIGPLLHHGSVGSHLPYGIKKMWKVIGFFAIFSGFFMLYIVKKNLSNMLTSVRNLNYMSVRIPILFASATAIYLIPMIASPGIFDRYLLLPILTAALFFLSCSDSSHIDHLHLKRTSIVALLLISICGLLSTAMMHDYLNWNRVRWQALSDLLDKNNIAPSRIDGGFEFNGAYLYSNEKAKPDNPKGWWVIDNEYLIAYNQDGPLTETEGYSVKAQYPTNVWLSFSPRNIFILHRE